MKSLIFFISLVSTATCKSPNFFDRNPRIIGGENGQIEEFPSLVSIYFKFFGIHLCGGTLISEEWVLTAAHCHTHPDELVVEYRTTERLGVQPGAKLAYVEDFISHEKFWLPTLVYDIALIKLKEPLHTGLHVPFAKLASPGNYYPTGTLATVAGWGVWSNDNSTDPPLQKVELQIWDYRNCKDAHKDNGTKYKVHPFHICAGVTNFSKAECRGDSGGPLFVNGVQVGIVSWSLKPCTVKKFPGVYTDVSYFIPWIQDKTGLDFEKQVFLIRKISN